MAVLEKAPALSSGLVWKARAVLGSHALAFFVLQLQQFKFPESLPGQDAGDRVSISGGPEAGLAHAASPSFSPSIHRPHPQGRWQQQHRAGLLSCLCVLTAGSEHGTAAAVCSLQVRL